MKSRKLLTILLASVFVVSFSVPAVETAALRSAPTSAAPSGSSTFLNGSNFCLGLTPNEVVVNVQCINSPSWSVSKSDRSNGFTLSQRLVIPPPPGPPVARPVPTTEVKCLTAPAIKDGEDLVMAQCGSVPATQQDWVGLPNSGIGLINSNFCLDVETGFPKIGSPIQIYTCQGLKSGDVRIPAQSWSYGQSTFSQEPTFENPWLPHPNTQSSTCADVLFIGFRGSGEHPLGLDENGSPSSDSWINWTSGEYQENRTREGTTPAVDHLGKTLGRLYAAISKRFKSKGKTTGFYSVGVSDTKLVGYGQNYAAPPLPITIDLAALPRYINSMKLDSLKAKGAVREPIDKYAIKCPRSTFLIAGYSQGAVMARSLALSNPLPGRISGVALIADPLFAKSDNAYQTGFSIDHQTNGVLKSLPEVFCSEYEVVKKLCQSTDLKRFFKSFKTSVEDWKDQEANKNLTNTTASALDKVTKKIAVICDSGDLVCSPFRLVSPNPLWIDTDISPASFIRIKLGLAIRHTQYGTKSPAWWNLRARDWLK